MDKKAPSPFRLLMDKKIYAILDGDKQFGDYEMRDDCSCIKIAMPYLSGSDLCELSTHFGLPMSYTWNGANLSRWQYLEKLFKYCIATDQCSDLLAYIFGKQQFAKMFSGHEVDAVDDAYKTFVQSIISRINGTLYFRGNELVRIGNQFFVRKIGEKVEVNVPKIRNIDREYIRSISSRAMDDVEQKNFDSAVTKSRTLLEEIFCYVIEKKGHTPSTSGNMGDLYKQVKDLYNMHCDAKTDHCIKTLLSGLEKIISSISEMRNKDSDAHGVGSNRITIDEHHARLFVNAAMAMADFILSVQNKLDAT